MSRISRLSPISHASGLPDAAADIEAALVIERRYGEKGELTYKGRGYAAFCDPPGVSEEVSKVTYYTFVKGSPEGDHEVIRLRPNRIPELLRKTPP
jgi:hypothetical protein